MKILKLPLAGLLFCTVPFWTGCGTSDKSEAPVSLTWEMGRATLLPAIMRTPLFLKTSPMLLFPKIGQSIIHSFPAM